MDNFHRAFFEPRSVAVIGASSDPAKLSYAIVDNMTRYGFRGSIYPIVTVQIRNSGLGKRKVQAVVGQTTP